MSDTEYHLRQYQTVYESTRLTMELMDEIASPRAGDRILDVGCGAGANCFHMATRWPAASLTGIDVDDELLAIAHQRRPPALSERCHYRHVDMFELARAFPDRPFDYTTLMHTLLLFPVDEAPRLLRSIFAATRRWVFLSSLFNDKRMDIEAHIRDHARYGDESTREHIYTILDAARFRDVCRGLGAKEVVMRDFDIAIDLPEPPGGGLGTYTRKLEGGRRLQFSGALWLPWKFVAIRLG